MVKWCNMEYGKVIYDFISTVLNSHIEKSNDEQKLDLESQVIDQVIDYVHNGPLQWNEIDDLQRKVYNDIALSVIREYIKSSPL